MSPTGMPHFTNLICNDIFVSISVIVARVCATLSVPDWVKVNSNVAYQSIGDSIMKILIAHDGTIKGTAQLAEIVPYVVQSRVLPYMDNKISVRAGRTKEKPTQSVVTKEVVANFVLRETVEVERVAERKHFYKLHIDKAPEGGYSTLEFDLQHKDWATLWTLWSSDNKKGAAQLIEILAQMGIEIMRSANGAANYRAQATEPIAACFDDFQRCALMLPISKLNPEMVDAHVIACIDAIIDAQLDNINTMFTHLKPVPINAAPTPEGEPPAKTNWKPVYCAASKTENSCTLAGDMKIDENTKGAAEKLRKIVCPEHKGKLSTDNPWILDSAIA